MADYAAMFGKKFLTRYMVWDRDISQPAAQLDDFATAARLARKINANRTAGDPGVVIVPNEVVVRVPKPAPTTRVESVIRERPVAKVPEPPKPKKPRSPHLHRNTTILFDRAAGDTYQTIADRHDLTRERVRQIVFKTMEHLVQAVELDARQNPGRW